MSECEFLFGTNSLILDDALPLENSTVLAEFFVYLFVSFSEVSPLGRRRRCDQRPGSE